ncbi:hypothetical protein CPB86DRAFT_827307 [Serendipita vermifera]|nr:hypothetical protein CPB86DRAFT_827307 [Serendipita vermifera]
MHPPSSVVSTYFMPHSNGTLSASQTQAKLFSKPKPRVTGTRFPARVPYPTPSFSYLASSSHSFLSSSIFIPPLSLPNIGPSEIGITPSLTSQELEGPMGNNLEAHDDRDTRIGNLEVSEQTTSTESTNRTQQVFDAVEGGAVVSIGEAGPSSKRRRSAKRMNVQGQSPQKEGRGQKRKRVDLANDAEVCLPPGSSKRVWTKMVARPSTVASKEGPSTEEETRPDCPDDSERTILRTGLSPKRFPGSRAAIAKRIRDHGVGSIAALFPKNVSVGTPCYISRRKGRGYWDNRYHCKATKKLGDDGEWEVDLVGFVYDAGGRTGSSQTIARFVTTWFPAKVAEMKEDHKVSDFTLKKNPL